MATLNRNSEGKAYTKTEIINRICDYIKKELCHIKISVLTDMSIKLEKHLQDTWYQKPFDPMPKYNKDDLDYVEINAEVYETIISSSLCIIEKIREEYIKEETPKAPFVPNISEKLTL